MVGKSVLDNLDPESRAKLEERFKPREEKRLHAQIGTLLTKNKKFMYDYDQDDINELSLEVIGTRVGKRPDEQITVIARNHPYSRICDACGKNEATYVELRGSIMATAIGADAPVPGMHLVGWQL